MNYPSHLRRRLVSRTIFLVVSKEQGGQVQLACLKTTCGYRSPWIAGLTSTEKRRQPCPKCNQGRWRAG